MKKLLSLSLAAMAMVGLAACSNEDVSTPVADGDGNFVVTVKLPAEMNRSFSDGLKATTLHYAVYNQGETTPIITEDIPGAFVNLTATVKCQLVNTKTYDMIFWADAPDNGIYTFDSQTQSVNVDYTAAGQKGINDEDADAFFAATTVTVNSPYQANVVLHRPFAQVNLGTLDYNTPAVQNGSLDVQTNFTTTAYQGLNLMTGDVSDPVTVAFNKGPAVGTAETFPVTNPAGIYYLSMDYILVAKDHAIQDGKFEIYNGANLINTVDVANMPVQRNYRTNIYGDLLTSQMNITITIDPIYDGSYNVETPAWNGEKVTLAPSDDGNYHVSQPGHLAYLAEYVNAGNSLSGKSIVIDNDIDLGNQSWTPIGTSSAPFNGNFDGQGHKIKNLYLNGEMTNMGLFGMTQNGKISNITVENAHITNTMTNADSGTGVIAGDPFTTTYSNITVTGEVQVSGYRYVGGMFGHNLYSVSSNLNMIIPNDQLSSSYVKATDSDWTVTGTPPAHVGGIVGYMGEGGSGLSNVTSNINVFASAPGVGGIAGTIQDGNVFTNVSCSGNVSLNLNNQYRNGMYAIGGIAGGYLGTVTFNQCTFTGRLSSIAQGTTVTLDPEADTVGIKYAGKTTGYVNTREGVTINS